MTPIPINIAVEDLLSEAVAKQLLLESGKNFVVGVVYNRGGYGYLKKTSQGWNNAAKGTPFFLLTDLDSAVCPSEIMASWLTEAPHNNFIFRVAVREIESWLLADSTNLSNFMKIHKTRVPENPDELNDPKATLVALASKSPLSQIRGRLVPRPQTTAKQGRDYNECLSEFVRTKWSPSQASTNSPSLDRCRKKLAAFIPDWR